MNLSAGAHRITRVLLILSLLRFSGCKTIPLPVPEYRVSPPQAPGRLKVGAARTEITPFPGYPLGGHSLGGRVSRGRWLPLYARAFYFEDSSGQSLVLVSCDLFALPAGLHERVAAMVNSTHPTLSRRNVILTATHTHQGPGNFMSSAFYNTFSSQLPGFDKSLFDTLVIQIGTCIVTAIDRSTAPGQAIVTMYTANVDALIKQRVVRQFVRNRAVGPFLTNPDACTHLYPHGPPLPCACAPELSNCDPGYVRYNAFTKALTVLTVSRLNEGKEAQVASLLFFGIHPTALSDHAAVYSSDFVGLAARSLEKASHSDDFVAGFFNGADGDVSPYWSRQDAEEVREIARQFLRAVAAATSAGGRLVADDTALVGAGRVAKPQRSFCDSNRPLMGVATVGGAEDGRAVSFDMGWRAPAKTGAQYKHLSLLSRLGLWRLGNPSQGRKQPALDYSANDVISVTDLLTPPGDYPQEVPVTAAWIGAVEFAVVPFEVTTLAAARLQAAVTKRTGRPTILLGLGNEYLSYLATSAEYQEQDYEGASTLYGQNSVECTERLLLEAVDAGNTPESPVVPADSFNAGPGPAFGMPMGPAFWGRIPSYSDAGLEAPFADELLASPWPRFEWQGEEYPRLAIYRLAGSWQLVTDDDDGFLLLELVDGNVKAASQTTRVWDAVWMKRSETDADRYVFVETPGEGGVGLPRCSPDFSLADVYAGRLRVPFAQSICPAGLPPP